jgi:hypothetical protein
MDFSPFISRRALALGYLCRDFGTEKPDAGVFRLIKSTARLSGEATGNVSRSINQESQI